VESSCERGNELSGSIKCWELPSGCKTCGLSSYRISSLVSGLRVSVRHLPCFISSPALAATELCWLLGFEALEAKNAIFSPTCRTLRPAYPLLTHLS
jgi:hypothetical protein